MDQQVHRVSVEVGGTQIEFETGKLAKQASGAVLVKAGDTHVLATATAGNERDVDFLPLTVDVEERAYAAGKIPGSFFRREGRAGEKATLTARRLFDGRIGVYEKSYDALNGADALAIITEWNEFREPDFAKMRSLMRAPIIFDGRNIYSPEHMRELGFTYFSIGR